MNNDLKKHLHLFGCKELPIKLLESLVEHDPDRIIPRPETPDECLRSETRILKSLISIAREEMPASRIRDWYLSSLSWYRANPLDSNSFRKALRLLKMKSFEEYKYTIKLGSNYAENVWALFEKKGGVIT